MRRFAVLVTVILGLGTLARPANAGVITGSINFAGAVEVSATETNWFGSIDANGTATPTDDFGADPNIAIITGSTIANGGVLVAGLQPPASVLQPPTLLHETDLSVATTPAGQPLNISMFEYGLLAPNINFVLQYITPCPGGTYSCFGSSPYGFIANDDGSTTIALTMSGIVFDTATPSLISTWSGLWTTNLNLTIAQIFAIIEPDLDANGDPIPGTGGSILNSYSATKITAFAPVPEPATLLTFGLGALVLAGASRRRRKA